MPDQNQSDPSQIPGVPPVTGNPPADQPTSPPVFSAASDLPPIPPAFQNITTDDTNSPATPQPTDEKKDDSTNPPTDAQSDTGSAAPPDTPPVISSPKKKFGSGRVIATILGVLLLIGGVGAGIFLTQQSQDLREKASGVTSPEYSLLNTPPCSDIGTGLNCSGGSVSGSTSCRQNNTQVTSPVNCCPPGQTIRNGSCSSDPPRCNDGRCETGEAQTCPTDCGGAAPPQCGSNLDCSFGTLGGSSACNSNGDTLNCCPAGQHQSNGTCVPGVANPCTSVGTGLSCGEFGVNGSISCTGNQFNSNGSTNTNAAINCCPAGKVYTYQGCVSQTQANSNCLPPSVLVTGDTGETVCVPYGNCQHHGGNCYVENGIGVNDGVDLAAGQSAVVCDNKGHWTTCAQGYQCNGLASNGGDCVPITHTGGGTTPPGSGNPTGQCMNVTAYNEAWSPLSGAQLANLTSGSVVNFCVIGSTTGGTFDRAQFKVNSTLEPETTTHRPTSTDFCQSYTITPTDTTVSVKAKIHHATLNTWFGESI